MTTEQIISIISEKNMYSEFVDNLNVDDSEITCKQALQDFYKDSILNDVDEDEERILALMEFTNENYDEAEKCIDNSYLVLLDNEADDRYEEYLDSYIEDCILPDLNDSYRLYFDEEAWKKDARVEGSRGNSLATYDGEEHEETINGTTYYIYRVD